MQQSSKPFELGICINSTYGTDPINMVKTLFCLIYERGFSSKLFDEKVTELYRKYVYIRNQQKALSNKQNMYYTQNIVQDYAEKLIECNYALKQEIHNFKFDFLKESLSNVNGVIKMHKDEYGMYRFDDEIHNEAYEFVSFYNDLEDFLEKEKKYLSDNLKFKTFRDFLYKVKSDYLRQYSYVVNTLYIDNIFKNIIDTDIFKNIHDATISNDNIFEFIFKNIAGNDKTTRKEFIKYIKDSIRDLKIKLYFIFDVYKKDYPKILTKDFYDITKSDLIDYFDLITKKDLMENFNINDIDAHWLSMIFESLYSKKIINESIYDKYKKGTNVKDVITSMLQEAKQKFDNTNTVSKEIIQNIRAMYAIDMEFNIFKLKAIIKQFVDFTGFDVDIREFKKNVKAPVSRNIGFKLMGQDCDFACFCDDDDYPSSVQYRSHLVKFAKNKGFKIMRFAVGEAGYGMWSWLFDTNFEKYPLFYNHVQQQSGEDGHFIQYIYDFIIGESSDVPMTQDYVKLDKKYQLNISCIPTLDLIENFYGFYVNGCRWISTSSDEYASQMNNEIGELYRNKAMMMSNMNNIYNKEEYEKIKHDAVKNKIKINYTKNYIKNINFEAFNKIYDFRLDERQGTYGDDIVDDIDEYYNDKEYNGKEFEEKELDKETDYSCILDTGELYVFYNKIAEVITVINISMNYFQNINKKNDNNKNYTYDNKIETNIYEISINNIPMKYYYITDTMRAFIINEHLHCFFDDYNQLLIYIDFHDINNFKYYYKEDIENNGTIRNVYFTYDSDGSIDNRYFENDSDKIYFYDDEIENYGLTRIFYFTKYDGNIKYYYYDNNHNKIEIIYNEDDSKLYAYRNADFNRTYIFYDYYDKNGKKITFYEHKGCKKYVNKENDNLYKVNYIDKKDNKEYIYYRARINILYKSNYKENLYKQKDVYEWKDIYEKTDNGKIVYSFDDIIISPISKKEIKVTIHIDDIYTCNNYYYYDNDGQQIFFFIKGDDIIFYNTENGKNIYYYYIYDRLTYYYNDDNNKKVYFYKEGVKRKYFYYKNGKRVYFYKDNDPCIKNEKGIDIYCFEEDNMKTKYSYERKDNKVYYYYTDENKNNRVYYYDTINNERVYFRYYDNSREPAFYQYDKNGEIKYLEPSSKLSNKGFYKIGNTYYNSMSNSKAEYTLKFHDDEVRKIFVTTDISKYKDNNYTIDYCYCDFITPIPFRKAKIIKMKNEKGDDKYFVEYEGERKTLKNWNKYLRENAMFNKVHGGDYKNKNNIKNIVTKIIIILFIVGIVAIVVAIIVMCVKNSGYNCSTNNIRA